MNRYLIAKETNDINLKFRKYNTIIYPKIENDINDIILISKAGDRLDLLSYKYYGDVTYWWIIAHANYIKGSLSITPGLKIRIPNNIEKIISDFELLNKGR